MTTPIRLVIADDHPIFRSGLRQVLEADPDLEVVAEAGDGETALNHLLALRPDVAILDVDMPKRDGLSVARTIREQDLRIALVILTMYKEERFVNAALDLGIEGYVLKDSAVTEIVDCVKSAAAGHHYLSPVLSALLLTRSLRTRTEPEKGMLTTLTPTERRVLRLIGDYKTSRQISDELCVSIRTIEHHRANIAAKLDLKGSYAILQYALKHLEEL